MQQVNPFSKEYLTDEERALPFWCRCDHYEFYTSYDPNKKQIHVVAGYTSDISKALPNKGFDLSKLMHDIMMFTMHWWPQVKDRLNGFTAYHIKFILHEYGWDPKNYAWEDMVIDTDNALNFDQGEGCE